MNDEELIKERVEKRFGLYDLLQTPYTDFEKYQVPFPLDKDEKVSAREELERIRKIKRTSDLKKRITIKLDKLQNEIKTRIQDNRKPLDPHEEKTLRNLFATLIRMTILNIFLMK
jgi:polynucleotide 5'-kinase involved in rRNA processing